MGRAAGALLAPRVVPGAVPGAPPTLDAAAAPRPAPTTAQAPEQPPGRERVDPPAVPAADRRDAAESAAPRREQTIALQVEVPHAPEQPSRSAGRRRAQTAERVHAVAEVEATTRVLPQAPLPAPTALPVELRPRPPAPPPIAAGPAAAQAHAQTVEVRIGKVEVRGPRPPELPGWSASTPPPAPAAPAEPAFARMAAARRYLDRSGG
jgi:hypothetical protein